VPGFVAEHVGQPGSGGGWDLYQVKGAESMTTRAGSLGSRKANRTGTPGQQIVIAKSSRQGPTPEMLSAYYTMMLYLSGDLNSGVLGPLSNNSQNDAASRRVARRWQSPRPTVALAIGDGLPSRTFRRADHQDLMLNYLGTDLPHHNYIQYTATTENWLTPIASGGRARARARRRCSASATCAVDQRRARPRRRRAAVAGDHLEYDRRSALVFRSRRPACSGPDPIRPTSPRSGPGHRAPDCAERREHARRSGYFGCSPTWASLCQVHGTPLAR
jgi:hypothetical protein